MTRIEPIEHQYEADSQPFDTFAATFDAITGNVNRVIRGKGPQTHLMALALVAGGHVRSGEQVAVLGGEGIGAKVTNNLRIVTIP